MALGLASKTTALPLISFVTFRQVTKLLCALVSSLVKWDIGIDVRLN